MSFQFKTGLNIPTGQFYQINGVNHVHSAIAMISGHGNGVTIPASTTQYGAPGFTGLTATRADIATPICLCTVYDLVVNVGTQPGTGNLVIHLMNGATATGITITVAAGEAGGTKSDLTHTASFALFDNLSLRYVNNATGASGVIRSWSAQIAIVTTD